MMKVAFIGDCHLGNHRQYGGELDTGMNSRFRSILRALEQAVGLANRTGCTELVIAGDLFDTPKPLPQQLVAVRSVLWAFKGGVHIILGNHDRVSDKYGDHGLGPLDDYANFKEGARIRVYDKPSVYATAYATPTVNLLLLPFDARPVAEWLDPALVEMKSKVTGSCRGAPWMMCGHFGLYEAHQTSTQPWLAGAHDAIEVSALARILTKHNVHHAFVGNYHTHGRWSIPTKPLPGVEQSIELHQLGALVPTGFDNPGFEYGRVEIWPGPDPVTVIPGPRFVVVHSREELDAVMKGAEPFELFVDWRCSPEAYADAKQAARALETGTPGEPGCVLIDVHVAREHSKQRAAAAAGAARSVDTLLDAIGSYTANCALPPQVSRERVTQHTRRFLGC